VVSLKLFRRFLIGKGFIDKGINFIFYNIIQSLCETCTHNFFLPGKLD
jgi:uncharacterized protein (UPF0179 family)